MKNYLESQLESLLFVANKALKLKDLAKFFQVENSEIKEAISNLKQEYQKNKLRGLEILEHQDEYQLLSSRENSQIVQNFFKYNFTGDLSPASLETLSVIAYREPVSKGDLERIRGVNCSLILRNLLMRGLVKENFDKKKQETYYSITPEFLKYLGLEKVQDLDQYDKLSKSETIEEILRDDN